LTKLGIIHKLRPKLFHKIDPSTGENTVIGRVAGLASDMKLRQTFISKEIHHFITLMIYFATLLGISFFAIAICLGYHWLDAVIFLIGTVVAMVPEGLLVTVTVSLALSAQKLASKNCLVTIL
jgi:sodium/potassium-transporting ATPase subunit alpha